MMKRKAGETRGEGESQRLVWVVHIPLDLLCVCIWALRWRSHIGFDSDKIKISQMLTLFRELCLRRYM